MADPVNVDEAAIALCSLVERALAGEDVVIGRAGVPLVRLVPVPQQGQRKLGQWRGKVQIAPDFDAPLTEEELADSANAHDRVQTFW